MPAYQDPDDELVVIFDTTTEENEAKTLAEGRPIFDEKEQCIITSPGSKDIKYFPATSFSRWVMDPRTGRQHPQSYAERFWRQYQQFKAGVAQTKSGTPLDYAPFLSKGRCAELKAQNVYTVEALADIEGAELKNLGPGGRDMKNLAMAYIEESRATAQPAQLMAELEALKARNAVLEEDLTAKKEREKEEGDFAGMTDSEIKDYITANTGQRPLGNPARRSLVRMAMECRPEKVA